MFVSGLIGLLMYGNNFKNQPKREVPKSKEENSKLGFLIPVLLAACFAILLCVPFVFPSKLGYMAELHRKIMLTFSGMSLSLLGGGYVIIPTMQQIIVGSSKWLTTKEFADAIALGQITPGPILISATFIGYKLAGFWGALNATLAIFLPPGLLMITCTQYLEKIRNSAAIAAIFKGLRPAIIGMISAAAFTIMHSNGFSLQSGLLFCIFLLLAIRYKLDPVFLIPGAGIIGLLIF
jgi:chromate transporter